MPKFHVDGRAGSQPRTWGGRLRYHALAGLICCGGFRRTGDRRAAPAPTPNDLFGSYLAGRYASAINNSRMASEYYLKALESDPDNQDLLERAFSSVVADGRFDDAVQLAKRLDSKSSSQGIARLVLLTDDIRQKRFDAALDRIAASPDAGFGTLTLPLVRAWIMAGQGKTDDAIKELHQLDKNHAYAPFQQSNAALIYDFGGQNDKAAEAYEKVVGSDSGVQLIDVLSYAYFLARTGADSRAKASARDLFQEISIQPDSDRRAGQAPGQEDAGAADQHGGGRRGGCSVLDRKLAGARRFVGTSGDLSPARDLPEARFRRCPSPARRFVAAAEPAGYGAPGISGDRPGFAAALECPAARVLHPQPDRPDRRRDRASQDRWSCSTRTISTRSPASPTCCGEKERYTEARTFTTARSRACIPRPPRTGRCSTPAASPSSATRCGTWPRRTFSTRSSSSRISHLVLNYLGYSWIERGTNLDRAAQMIMRAAELLPDDGYIVDSVGWLKFRRGDYKGAIEQLERAVLLHPEDPTINDHLGDAYWMMNRHLEARFQWRHALAMKPDSALAATVEEKLKRGLKSGDKQGS